DEVRQGVVVQVAGAADMAAGETLRVADVDHHGALLAQDLGLFRGDAFEFAHWAISLQSQRYFSPLSIFIRVMAPPHTQPLSRANRPGSSQRPSRAAQWPKMIFCPWVRRCGQANQGA